MVMFIGILIALLSPLILGTQIIFQKKSNLGAAQQTIISLVTQFLIISIITIATLNS
jgi:hypothetical protein